MTCDEMVWPKMHKAVDCDDKKLEKGDSVRAIYGSPKKGVVIDIRDDNMIVVEERVIDTKHKHGPKEWVYRWVLPAKQVKQESSMCGDRSEVLAKA